LKTVTVDIKRIHSVDIVSIGTEIYQKNLKIVNFGMRHLPQCSYDRGCILFALNSTDASMEEWPTSSETTIIYLQNDV
jgi:hypothetical protein